VLLDVGVPPLSKDSELLAKLTAEPDHDKRVEFLLDAADAGTAKKLAKYAAEQMAGQTLNEVIEKYYQENPRPFTSMWPLVSELVVEEGPLGVTLSDCEGGVEVTGVDEGSKAQEQGVELGSRILAINGELMHGLEKVVLVRKIKAMEKPWRIEMLSAKDVKMRDFMEAMNYRVETVPAKFKPESVSRNARALLGIHVDA
jgi:predicted metalloprotease with PDZ domain